MPIKKCLMVMALLMAVATMEAQNNDTTGVWKEKELQGVTIRSGATTRRVAGAVNGTLISKDELFKAACCNLGESFTTNPSVDVNYSDAATGAKQIKLLGLSGTYVQMLTENLPNFRGAAAPYSLGYVPGPWMKSIQVSKGSASVRNGYESITGQIDVEYLKPDDDQGVTVNLFGNTMSKFEANADANLHLNGPLATEILAHYENDWGGHDRNHDGFVDMPKVRQYNLQNRWRSVGEHYIFHAGLGILKEKREGAEAGEGADWSFHLTSSPGGWSRNWNGRRRSDDRPGTPGSSGRSAWRNRRDGGTATASGRRAKDPRRNGSAKA